MSMENAKKLIKELQTNNARLEEFAKAPTAFLEASGYDCTVDELKEALTLAQSLGEKRTESRRRRASSPQ